MVVRSLAVDVSVLALVVLGMSLVLSLVVLILSLLDDIQLFHDVLSLWFVLPFDLLDELLGLRSWVEGFLVQSLCILHGFGGVESTRVLRNSQRRNITLLARRSRVSRSLRVRRTGSLLSWT